MGSHFDQSAVLVERRFVLRSRLNPRQRFDSEKRDRMAKSTREKGVLVPLLGRLLPSEVDVLPNGRGLDVWAGEVLVAQGVSAEEAERLREVIATGKAIELADGACRLEASGELKVDGVMLGALHELPVIVRDLSDAEMLEIMMTTAIQRAELNELEECDGFARMLDLRDPASGMALYSMASLARKLAVSEDYVQSRLSLRRMSAEGRKAFLDGQMSFSVAYEVCTAPPLMDLLVDVVANPGKFPIFRDVEKTGAPVTVEEVIRLKEHYSRLLSGVAFKLDDAELCPVRTNEAGERVSGGACVGCPSNTATAAKAEADAGAKRGRGRPVVPAARCLNPACFDRKVEIFAAAQLKKRVDVGATMLEGAEKREAVHGGPNGSIGMDWVDLDAEIAPEDSGRDGAGKTWGEVVSNPEGVCQVREYVTTDDRGQVKRLAKREEAVTAARMLDHGAQIAVSRGGARSVEEEEIETKQKEREKAKEQEVAVRKKVALDVMAAIVAAARAVVSVPEALCAALIPVAVRHADKAGSVWVCRRREIDPGLDAPAALLDFAKGLEGADCLAFLVELLFAQDFCGAGNPNVGDVVPVTAVGVLKVLGVDARAIEKKVRKEAK